MVTATPKSKTLAIEVQTGTNLAGSPIYGKKNFSGVKLAATNQGIYNVGEAIKLVLSANTDRTLVNEVDTLVNA